MDIGDLKALPEMNRTALCTQWQECFKKPAPDGVRKELLVRMLAYRILQRRGLPSPWPNSASSYTV